MGLWEGLLGGFVGRKREFETQQLEESRLTQAREAKVYEALINSPDPEISTLATAGLLESAQPRKRKGGLQGWLGEMAGSPIYSRLQQMVQTPVTEEKATLPARSLQPMITATPGEAPAAQAAGAPVEGTAPPPQLSYQQTGGTPYRTQRPRQIFRTPEQETYQKEIGQVRAEVEGDKMRVAAGLPPRYGTAALRAAGYQRVAVETPDGQQHMALFDPRGGPGRAYLDADTGQPLMNAQPLQRTAGTSLGIYAERAARELGYPSAAAAGQAGADAMRRVNDRAEQMQAESAGASTAARGAAPLSTTDRFRGVTQLRDEWRKVEEPLREMQRQQILMQTGINRYKAGDRIGGSQAVLVTFQKILDPTSVVRESEYARSPQGLGLVDRLQGMYDRYIGQYDPVKQQWVAGGAGVPEAELAEMVETARQFLANMEGWNAGTRQNLEKQADEYGLPKDQIFGATMTAPPPPVTTPGAASATTPAAPTSPQSTVSPGRFVLENGVHVWRGAPAAPTPPPTPNIRPVPSH